MAKIQSVEPNIADLANGWLKSYKRDYKLEQESLNTEIDQALNDYYSKNGGVGGNRPDAKLLLQDKNLVNYPILIEYKGYKEKLLKVFNAELKLDIRGGIGTEKEVHSASREIITKTLHDAAFDIAYDSITPVCLTSNGQDQDDYGAYVELTRVFDVVDFDYLERIFSKGGLIEYLKKTEKEKIETTASVATESLNRSQQRSNSNAIRAKIKEAVAASGKQYDGIKEIIDMVRQIIPYNRMLISSDGYLIPLDDRYFRIDAQNLGFKYGGEITCVGMITNIIGEDTDPNDSQNIFATLQFSVNEVLRQLLPTKERNLCVIHPIAVYYGN